MKAVLLIKQWPIWCIASIYDTGRLISITSEAGGMLKSAETWCLDSGRNQTEEECGLVLRSLAREKGMLDPAAGFGANIFCVIGQVTPGEVKLKENLVHHSQLYFWKYTLHGYAPKSLHCKML